MLLISPWRQWVLMTSLPTTEIKCQQDGKEPRSFGDENKGQSSEMEWGGQCPRNANSNLAAEREREWAGWRGVERAQCVCQLKGVKEEWLPWQVQQHAWRQRGAGPQALLRQTVSYSMYINSQRNPAFPRATAVILTLCKGSWCSCSDNKRMLGKDQRSHKTKGNSLNKSQI